MQTAEANVSAARSHVETARLELDSKQMLFNEKVVSDYELANAKNAFNVAQAQLKQAEAQAIQARNSLSYTTVSSPADGVVGTLPYRVGALVSPQLPQPLTTVSDNSQMYVYFSLSEKDLQSLIRQYGSTDKMLTNMPRLGLQLSDGTMYEGEGHIEAVSGVLNASTGSGQLRAVFDNRDGILLTGGTGNVILPHKLTGAISIPQSATYELQDKIFVYTVVDGKARSTPITVHPVSDGKTYTVTEGLKDGDVIVFATPVYFYNMSGRLKTLIDRCCARFLEMKNKEFYFIATMGEDRRDLMERAFDSIRGFLMGCPHPVEKGVIAATKVLSRGDINNSPALQEAYDMGKNV